MLACHGTARKLRDSLQTTQNNSFYVFLWLFVRHLPFVNVVTGLVRSIPGRPRPPSPSDWCEKGSFSQGSAKQVCASMMRGV